MTKGPAEGYPNPSEGTARELTRRIANSMRSAEARGYDTYFRTGYGASVSWVRIVRVRTKGEKTQVYALHCGGRTEWLDCVSFSQIDHR